MSASNIAENINYYLINLLINRFSWNLQDR